MLSVAFFISIVTLASAQSAGGPLSQLSPAQQQQLIAVSQQMTPECQRLSMAAFNGCDPLLIETAQSGAFNLTSDAQLDAAVAKEGVPAACCSTLGAAIQAGCTKTDVYERLINIAGGVMARFQRSLERILPTSCPPVAAMTMAMGAPSEELEPAAAAPVPHMAA